MIDRQFKQITLFLIVFSFVIAGCATFKKAKQEVKEELPPAIEVAEPIQKKEMPPLTYAAVTNLIGEFLDIQPVKNASGSPEFLGVSENKLVTLEIIGEEQAISQASIKVIYPADIDKVNVDLNNAMMARFLTNVAPDFEDWTGSVRKMVERFSSMALGAIERDEIRLNGKTIQILYNKSEHSIIVTVNLNKV